MLVLDAQWYRYHTVPKGVHSSNVTRLHDKGGLLVAG